MIELTTIQVQKKNSGKCVRPGCSKDLKPKRIICSMHAMRDFKISCPVAYTFNALKQNAKRRGKDFSLTVEQFKRLIQDSGYMENKGRTYESLQIDRKINSIGYHYFNCQVITADANLRKRFVDAKIAEWEARKAGINIQAHG